MILAIGGHQHPHDVEILEISPPDHGQQQCTKPADIPAGSTGGMVGAFHNGRPLVCGGPLDRRCWQYSIESREWSLAPFQMSDERYYAASVLLTDGTFLVMGGSSGGESRSERLEVEDFASGPDLPARFSEHCTSLVNLTHVFVGGGRYVPRSAYLMDVTSEDYYWALLPDMIMERKLHSCGVVDGKVVIAGGAFQMTVSEILDMGSGQWRIGPEQMRF